MIGKLADGVVVGDTRRVAFHPRERGDFFVADTGATVSRADVVLFNRVGKCHAEGI